MQQHVVNRIKKGGAGGGVDHFSINRNVEWQRGRGLRGRGYRASREGVALSLELPRVGDGDLLRGFAALAAVGLHLLHHLHPLHHPAEHHVLPIEPARRHGVNRRPAARVKVDEA